MVLAPPVSQGVGVLEVRPPFPWVTLSGIGSNRCCPGRSPSLVPFRPETLHDRGVALPQEPRAQLLPDVLQQFEQVQIDPEEVFEDVDDEVAHPVPATVNEDARPQPPQLLCTPPWASDSGGRTESSPPHPCTTATGLRPDETGSRGNEQGSSSSKTESTDGT